MMDRSGTVAEKTTEAAWDCLDTREKQEGLHRRGDCQRMFFGIS
jgi:hypothetical protein